MPRQHQIGVETRLHRLIERGVGHDDGVAVALLGGLEGDTLEIGGELGTGDVEHLVREPGALVLDHRGLLEARDEVLEGAGDGGDLRPLFVVGGERLGVLDFRRQGFFEFQHLVVLRLVAGRGILLDMLVELRQLALDLLRRGGEISDRLVIVEQLGRGREGNDRDPRRDRHEADQHAEGEEDLGADLHVGDEGEGARRARRQSARLRCHDLCLRAKGFRAGTADSAAAAGRALTGNRSANCRIWAGEASIGDLKTVHSTPSEQGGVVSEP